MRLYKGPYEVLLNYYRGTRTFWVAVWCLSRRHLAQTTAPITTAPWLSTVFRDGQLCQGPRVWIQVKRANSQGPKPQTPKPQPPPPCTPLTPSAPPKHRARKFPQSPEVPIPSWAPTSLSSRLTQGRTMTLGTAKGAERVESFLSAYVGGFRVEGQEITQVWNKVSAGSGRRMCAPTVPGAVWYPCTVQPRWALCFSAACQQIMSRLTSERSCCYKCAVPCLPFPAGGTADRAALWQFDLPHDSATACLRLES